MKKTDEGIQKFEILALFFNNARKSACRTKTSENAGKTIPALVSEKAQAGVRKVRRTAISARSHRKDRRHDILNDCSMAPAPATSLQAPGTWARENRITALDRRTRRPNPPSGVNRPALKPPRSSTA
ncbi:hypothetical protein [Pararhizobium sp.]|uniref:hypothetical protein n=1 Tax=Pararhizobium sp. TaxID=1977563 RepID=UPI003BAA83F2